MGTARPIVEIVDFAQMRAREGAWDELLSRAVYANPFYGPAIMRAHAAQGFASTNLRFLVVQRSNELLAVLPFMPNGWTGFRRSHVAWTSKPLVTNSTPLIASNGLEENVEALLDGMAAAGGRPLWRFPMLSVGTPVGRALLDGVGRRGFAAAVVSSFDRAVLDRRDGYETYAAANLSRSRRKGLLRRRRQLERLGRLEHTSFESGESLRQAVEAFLALEASGWKGKRGTALASRPQTAALARTLFGADGGHVTGRADVLQLDASPIAISLALRCAGTAYLLKTAHDEAFRKFGPGLVLEDAIVQRFHDTGFADRLDSSSTAGCVLEELFADREPIGDLVVATEAATASAMVARAAREQRWRSAATEGLRSLYGRALH